MGLAIGKPKAGLRRPRDERTSVSKTKRRVTITIDEDICKGCGLCVAACPRHAMNLADHINGRGFHPVALTDPDSCTGCAQCAIMCPDTCIRIVKEEKEE